MAVGWSTLRQDMRNLPATSRRGGWEAINIQTAVPKAAPHSLRGVQARLSNRGASVAWACKRVYAGTGKRGM